MRLVPCFTCLVSASWAAAVPPLLRRAVDSSGEVVATSDAKRPYFDLLVIVPSNAAHVEQRAAIRDSWAKYVDADGHCQRCASNRTIKILFGVGSNDHSILNETESFRDIALVDLPDKDRYRNLTTKVRKCIEYAVEQFRFALLLKVDTDSFVFMDRFLRLVEQQKLFNSSVAYAGAFQSDARPDETGGKWTDRTYRQLTGHARFPKYARGAGYVLSPLLCRFIADSGESLPALQPLPNEDVSIGFWLEPVVHEKVELPVAHLPIGCRDASQVIDHHVMPKLMAMRWKNLEASEIASKLMQVGKGVDTLLHLGVSPGVSLPTASASIHEMWAA